MPEEDKTEKPTPDCPICGKPLQKKAAVGFGNHDDKLICPDPQCKFNHPAKGW